MGWKSTTTITRNVAIDLILARMDRSIYENMSNEDLSDMVGNLYGDDPNLPLYGYNFTVSDDTE